MKLDNKNIYDALILGADNVINQKELLNSINVFPIQDNDTGNNLSAMMQSIIQKAKLGQTIDETLHLVAEAALTGSRGNSGLIFSQFLYGLTKTFSTGDNTKNYQLRFQSAVQYAYDAISNPVEGTMITLMKRLSQLLSEQMDTKRLENSLTHIYENLKTTLDETTNSLEILKKHQVVDAGALGFMLFIEGFMQGILNQKSYELGINQKQVHPLHDQQTLSDHINNRYCMEVLLKTCESKLHLTTLLNNLGDSLVIGKQDELMRIHIHTNTPDIIIEKVKPLGMILETKVDDMQKQYQAIHDDANDIAILTDSIADLPQSLIDDYPIYVFNVGLQLGDVTYYDKQTIKHQKLLDIIKTSNEHPTSFTPSIKILDERITNLLKYYKKLIIVTVSSKMSSMYQLYTKVISSYPEEHILLIDSKQNSVSEGLIVYELAKQIKMGKTFEDIAKDYKELIKKTSTFVHVDTLDLMVKSGRIKKSLGWVAKVLRLKPIVSNKDGEGIVLAKSIGKKRNLKKMVHKTKNIHRTSGIDTYAIAHVSNLKLAEQIKLEMIKITGKQPSYISDVSSIIAMNSGKNSVAVGIIRKEL